MNSLELETRVRKTIATRIQAAFKTAGLTHVDDVHATVPFMPKHDLQNLLEGKKSPFVTGGISFTPEAQAIAKKLKTKPEKLFAPSFAESTINPRDALAKLWFENGDSQFDTLARDNLLFSPASARRTLVEAFRTYFPQDTKTATPKPEEKPKVEEGKPAQKKVVPIRPKPVSMDKFLLTGIFSSIQSFEKKWAALRNNPAIKINPIALNRVLRKIETLIPPQDRAHLKIGETVALQMRNPDGGLRADINPVELANILQGVEKLGFTIPASIAEALPTFLAQQPPERRDRFLAELKPLRTLAIALTVIQAPPELSAPANG